MSHCEWSNLLASFTFGSFCCFHSHHFLPIGNTEGARYNDKHLDFAVDILWLAGFKVHWRMNASCDSPDQFSRMPIKQIKTSTCHLVCWIQTCGAKCSRFSIWPGKTHRNLVKCFILLQCRALMVRKCLVLGNSRDIIRETCERCALLSSVDKNNIPWIT